VGNDERRTGPPEDALQDLRLIVEAVTAAGRTAMGLFRAPVGQWLKGDGSPVSDADIAVDNVLEAALRPARPGYGWISEETAAAGVTGRAFVVDPIDGTRAFLKGEDGWTIVAAVVEEGRPLAAAIHRPARDSLYTAAVGGGAFRNGAPVTVSRRDTAKGARVAMPGALWRDGGFRAAGVRRGGWVASLALRLARVARGASDAVITKEGPHHWDLAAADLILHEAGGTLTTLTGAVPRYDAAVTRHGRIIAGPPALAERLRRMTAEHLARAG
jgi:myo-inositol-1(or 4)-monophosphatase